MGKPDQKDLNENMAATQGLSHMITDCKKLFQVGGCSVCGLALPPGGLRRAPGLQQGSATTRAAPASLRGQRSPARGWAAHRLRDVCPRRLRPSFPPPLFNEDLLPGR